MDPSPTLQSKSELFWYCQSSALASQIVTLRSNFAVWQDTSSSPPRSPRALLSTRDTGDTGCEHHRPVQLLFLLLLLLKRPSPNDISHPWLLTRVQRCPTTASVSPCRCPFSSSSRQRRCWLSPSLRAPPPLRSAAIAGLQLRTRHAGQMTCRASAAACSVPPRSAAQSYGALGAMVHRARPLPTRRSNGTTASPARRTRCW